MPHNAARRLCLRGNRLYAAAQLLHSIALIPSLAIVLNTCEIRLFPPSLVFGVGGMGGSPSIYIFGVSLLEKTRIQKFGENMK